MDNHNVIYGPQSDTKLLKRIRDPYKAVKKANLLEKYAKFISVTLFPWERGDTLHSKKVLKLLVEHPVPCPYWQTNALWPPPSSSRRFAKQNRGGASLSTPPSSQI